MNIAIAPVHTRNTCDVAIVGAGPYGLAAAAHLRAAGVETRIFGEPMSFWRSNMPHGMKLRSPWVATHFAHPHGGLSLDDYYRETGLDCRSCCRLQTSSTTASGFSTASRPISIVAKSPASTQSKRASASRSATATWSLRGAW